MGKRKEINHDQVSEGKRRLSYAINRASVDYVRDALLFLSTTALACEVPNQERDCDTTTGGCRKSLNINVDFQVRVPRHCELFLPDSDPCETTHSTPLVAALGRDPVHTEMVRCLLTPQTLRVSKDSTNYSSIGTVVDIATNAREMIRNKINCEWEEPITPLEAAMEYGNITLVRLLLEHGADPNQKSDVTPLVLACQGGIENEIEIAKLLLEYSADPNERTDDGMEELTPLEVAIEHGNIELVRLLLEHGADPNQKAEVTPLVLACQENEIEIAKLLLEHGADPNERTDDGMEELTPLEVAIEHGNIELVRLLLEHGADPNQKADVTPLVLACQGDIENEIEIAEQIVKLLLEHGADPNDCTNDGLTPVVRMSRIGNLKMVKLLLLPEAAVNNNTNASNDDNDCTNTNNNSINYHYCFHKNRWGTNVFHYDQQSMNALMHACAENHEDVVRFLANGGSNAAAVASYVNDYRVDPALWYASAHGSATIVRFLMDECGARASYRKDPAIYSSTPLEEASQWGHVSTVKALLERSGSDPRTSSGQKARTQAERSGHSEVVELLDVWRDRLDCIEDSSTTFPLGFLPLLLSRSNDSAHRILCNHAGSLFCCRNQKVCVDK